MKLVVHDQRHHVVEWDSPSLHRNMQFVSSVRSARLERKRVASNSYLKVGRSSWLKSSHVEDGTCR